MQQIPFWLPVFGARESDLIAEVVASGFVDDGDYTTQLEQAVAVRLGVRHAVAVTSGTTALYAALKVLDIGPGDEVIVPSVTFIATANAVTMTGATPVIVDVDRRTLGLSVDAAHAALTDRTRAVIPVHVSGRPAHIDAVVAFADEHRLAIVEDAAEALASAHAGRPLGTFGHMGCFSLSPNKVISTGQGGLVVTNDDDLHARLREFKDQGRPTRGTGGADTHVSVGFNLKLTNLQAAVGLAQLEQLDARLDTLCGIYRRYADRLADVDGVTLLGFDLDAGQRPLWVDAIAERRDELFSYLGERGMQCRRFWLPLHQQPPYRRDADTLPNAEWSSTRAIWLPSAFTLSDAQVDEVCAHVRKFYGA